MQGALQECGSLRTNSLLNVRDTNGKMEKEEGLDVAERVWY